MRESLPSNGTTTITRSEFSDDNFDEEEVQDEESAPDDGKLLCVSHMVGIHGEIEAVILKLVKTIPKGMEELAKPFKTTMFFFRVLLQES